MKKILIIFEKNKKIRFKNREVRTPVSLEVTDRDIKHLTLEFKMADIQNYTIKTQEKQKDVEPLFIELENKEISIEELDLEDSEKEPKSILENLINGEYDERD